MGKGGKKTTRQIFGHVLTKREQGVLNNLVAMTTQRLHISRRMLKSEARLWAGIKLITGDGPKEGEVFISAVFRINYWLAEMTKRERDRMIEVVDRAAFHEAMAALLTGKDREQYVALRTPAVLHPRVKMPSVKMPSVNLKDEFYKSWDWRTLRLEVIKEHGRACQCCGAMPGMMDAAGDPVRICVDHIKPISKYWHLRLVRSNLQILCDECNMGKGNWDETDFRPVAVPDEWIIADNDDIALTVLNELALPEERSERQTEAAE